MTKEELDRLEARIRSLQRELARTPQRSGRAAEITRHLDRLQSDLELAGEPKTRTSSEHLDQPEGRRT